MDKIKAQQIKNLKTEIATLKRNLMELERQRQDLDKVRKIDSIPGIILYYDRIVGKDRIIDINSGFVANLEKSGEITYSTEVRGGGARPTLTRVVTGAAMAGGLGGAIGMTAQKQKKIKSKTTEHDNRSLFLSINSDEGNIVVSLKPDLEPKARQFINNMLNARIDYPKVKNKIESERKRLTAEIDSLNKEDLISKKEKELESIINMLSPEEKKKADKATSAKTSSHSVTLWFVMSIIWLSLFFIPIVPIIFLIISLVKSCKNKNLGIIDKRVTATKILSVIGLSLNALLYLEVIFNPSSNNINTNTDYYPSTYINRE